MDTDPSQEPRTEPRLSQRIIDTAIDLAEHGSWETVRLHAVAARLGISLDDRGVFREKEDVVGQDRSGAGCLVSGVRSPSTAGFRAEA